MKILDRILRAGEGRKVKALSTLVPDINALGDEYGKLTDDELRAKTPEFKERLDNGEDLEDLMIEAFADWGNALVERGVARRSVIGASEQGRPLHMLALGNPGAREVLLVLGRQHPPETTGSQALMGFVDEVAADSPLARKFRERMLVLVVPLLNPDGVVEGNWRGNINGQDLNRDWGLFTQSETRAARDLLERVLDDDGRRLAFAIDFHSTWSDVFYTVEEAPSRGPGGVLRRWIDDMQQRFPGRIRESASPSGSSAVFKNWAFRQYRAPTVTYEVGDKTGSEQLHELATFAATLERVCVETVEKGQMTKDLAILIGPDQPWMTTEQFFEAIRSNLETAMSAQGLG